jgi:splicing factor 3A subunit 3
VEELLEVGTERIKEALEQYGLKVGGTPEQRAARLLLLKDTPLEELDAKHFAKGKKPPQKGGQANGESEGGRKKLAEEVALQEAKVRRFCELLKQVREDRPHFAGPSFQKYTRLAFQGGGHFLKSPQKLPK